MTSERRRRTAGGPAQRRAGAAELPHAARVAAGDAREDEPHDHAHGAPGVPPHRARADAAARSAGTPDDAKCNGGAPRIA